MISAPEALLGVQLLDPLGDGAQRVDVEARVGLVEDRDVRLEHRHLQDLRALLLPAGEALVEVARGERAVHVEQLDRVLQLGAELFDVDRLLAFGVDRHAQEVRHGDPRDRHRVLEGEEQPRLRALVRLGLGDVLALEEDRALGHLVRGVAEQGVGERGLARPVGAHQRVHLPALDGQVDAAEDLALLDAHVQVANLQVGHGLLWVRRWMRSAGRPAGQARRAPATGRRAWCSSAC